MIDSIDTSGFSICALIDQHGYVLGTGSEQEMVDLGSVLADANRDDLYTVQPYTLAMARADKERALQQRNDARAAMEALKRLAGWGTQLDPVADQDGLQGNTTDRLRAAIDATESVVAWTQEQVKQTAQVYADMMLLAKRGN